MSAPARQPITSAGIVYLRKSDTAQALAETISERLDDRGITTWTVPSRADEEVRHLLPGTELMIVLGGDGTILSVARQCAELQVPILGVNFGRVGFLSELEPEEVEEKLSLYLDGSYWIDERSMLYAEVGSGTERSQFTALNDIVLVRGAEPRVIRLKVWIDGHYYNTTVADGVIISTATGSTAYNLAAGGPILHPQVRSNVLTPIAPHLVADRSLILEPAATVTLELQPGSPPAILSADGQMTTQVRPGAQVLVKGNTHITRFLRRRPPTYFYRVLSGKLREDF